VRAALAEMELLQRIGFDTVKAPHPSGETAEGRRVATMTYGDSANPILMISLAAPKRSEFIEQLESVFAFAELRAERTGEILSQVVPQTAYWSAICGLTPERHRYTLELLGVGLRFAMMVIMRFKAMLNCPRPVEYSALVQPMILTPGYSAFPSGHATEATFAAELLSALHGAERGAGLLGGLAGLPGEIGKDDRPRLQGQLHRLAFRVAENRVVAGLHFPIDSLAGQLLGLGLARYFVWSCLAKEESGSATSPYPALPWPYRFGYRSQGLGKDANMGVVQPKLDVPFDARLMDCAAQGPKLTSVPRPTLSWLWERSRAECKA